MGNVIKVRLKKAGEVGIGGTMTKAFEAGTEGIVIDAQPNVRDGVLIADILVLFPEQEFVALFLAEELEVIGNPMANKPQEEALGRMIAELASVLFEMHENGIDITKTGLKSPVAAHETPPDGDR